MGAYLGHYGIMGSHAELSVSVHYLEWYVSVHYLEWYALFRNSKWAWQEVKGEAV